MKSTKNIIESSSLNILLILISTSLILYPNCAGSRIERISEPPSQFTQPTSSENFLFLKLHMKNGDLYLLENWRVLADKDSVTGSGKLFDPNRDVISKGQFTVPIQQVVLAETNQINEPVGTVVLAALTIVTGIFTIVCIVNPKACFGSCPTFYAYNGDDYIVQSEGFSSSISPSMEERDIDALFRIKPNNEDFTVQLKNEAYETHIIRAANLLALPKPESGRVFSSPDDNFYQAINITEASAVVADEGDISEKLCSFDGVERFSEADSNNLASKEIIDITFKPVSCENLGLVIAARQTLLTTFLFYQTLAYLGTTAGDWLANVERNSDQFRSILEKPRSELGNIDVLQQNDNGEWVQVGEVGETGPIATDIKIVPLKKVSDHATKNSSINLKLRMAKGLWRIDYVALAELKDKVRPIVIQPCSSSPQFTGNSDVIEILKNPDSVLVTYPGDKFLLNYKLPADYYNYELFMESQGYYLEWMRNEWLAEENTGKIFQMLFNPQQYYKDLAPQFKKVEAEMEETFWSSKYVYP